jgi:putative transcriptional regulator
MPNVKNNVSKILGERLISITDVSNATGISRTALTAIYYRKNKGIQFETIEKLCDYLQVPMSELFEYEPKKGDSQ